MDPQPAQPTPPLSNELPPGLSPKRFPFQKIVTVLLGIFVIVVLVIAWRNGTMTGDSKVSQQSKTTAALPTTSVIPTEIQTLTTEALEKLGSIVDLTKLPLGDKKYTTSGPKKGYIYLCRVMNGEVGGAQGSPTWISGGTWNKTAKPSVSGSATWPNATFSDSTSGSTRIIIANNLPVDATTGTFPIKSSDPAYQYDQNPNTISGHSFVLQLPVSPTVSSTPNCMGGEVGVMLNGVPLFNGFDAENRDAQAHEVQDSCDGHPEKTGEYHYHGLSRCIKDMKVTTVIGFALDGYPITGPVLANNERLTTNSLDECHGLTSPIVLGGKTVTMYHYVMTDDFPYSVSCFKGKPVQMQVIPINAGGSQQSLTLPRQSEGGDTGGQKRQPPEAAFTACSTQSQGASCTVSTPNGSLSGTCQRPPDQTSLVCVPANAPSR